jgi:hypothetical protein
VKRWNKNDCIISTQWATNDCLRTNWQNMRNKSSMRKSSQEDKMWSFCYIDNTDLHLSLLFQPNICKVNGCSTELTESIEIMGLKSNLPEAVFSINFSLTFRSDMLNLCIRKELKRLQQKERRFVSIRFWEIQELDDINCYPTIQRGHQLSANWQPKGHWPWVWKLHL